VSTKLRRRAHTFIHRLRARRSRSLWLLAGRAFLGRKSTSTQFGQGATLSLGNASRHGSYREPSLAAARFAFAYRLRGRERILLRATAALVVRIVMSICVYRLRGGLKFSVPVGVGALLVTLPFTSDSRRPRFSGLAAGRDRYEISLKLEKVGADDASLVGCALTCSQWREESPVGDLCRYEGWTQTSATACTQVGLRTGRQSFSGHTAPAPIIFFMFVVDALRP